MTDLFIEDFRKPTWSCVRFVRGEVTPTFLGRLRAAGVVAAELTVSDRPDDAELLSAVARAFRFPGYFGQNWNAADECLRDLGTWLPAEAGYVLVVRNAKALWRDATRVGGILVETWLHAAEEWAAEGKGFHLVLELGAGASIGGTILWPDATVESLTVDYDDVVLRVRESGGRRRRLRCAGHVGVQLTGFWDENIVERAAASETHPFAEECLAHAARGSPSGSAARNAPGKAVLEIVFLDGCRLLVCATRFVVEAPEEGETTET